jgi:hypothetical protein
MNDSFFEKIEKKTNVNKNTILNLASRLQNGNFKDEKTLRSIIRDISKMTGKEVSEEREKKIIEAIINDKVPKDVDKYI